MAEAVFQVVPKREASEWVYQLVKESPTVAPGLLLSGDRWSCVDEVVLAKIDQEIIGIATIAFQGEEMSGKPTIVAVYVMHRYRRQGIGKKLLEVAVDYMLSKGVQQIHLEALSSKMLRVAVRLPPEKRQKVLVRDMSMGGFADAMLET